MVLTVVPVDGVIFSGGFNSDLYCVFAVETLFPRFTNGFKLDLRCVSVAIFCTNPIKLTALTSSIYRQYIASLEREILIFSSSIKLRRSSELIDLNPNFIQAIASLIQ